VSPAARRRAALVVAAAVVAALASPALAQTGDPTTTAPAAPTTTTAPAAPTTTAPPVLPAVQVRTPTAADPLRVLLFGDSVMATAGPGVDAALRATGAGRAVNATAPAFGLTSLYDWRAEWPSLLARERPDVIVLMFGGWDTDMIRLAGPAYYQRLVDQAIAMMATTGALITFVGMPTTGQVFGAQPTRRLVNGFFQRAAAAHPGAVAYLAPEPWLDDPLQNFRSFAQGPDGRWERLHKDKDDVHLCAAGAALFGAGLVDGLRGLGVPLPPLAATDWQHGAWTGADVYADPPDGCPSTTGS
jgi:hypothetical protein